MDYAAYPIPSVDASSSVDTNPNDEASTSIETTSTDVETEPDNASSISIETQPADVKQIYPPGYRETLEKYHETNKNPVWGSIVTRNHPQDKFIVKLRTKGSRVEKVRNQLGNGDPRRTSRSEQLAEEKLGSKGLRRSLRLEMLAKKKLAQEKLAQEKLAQEKLAQEKLAQEKLAQGKLAQEKLAQGKLAQEKSITTDLNNSSSKHARANCRQPTSCTSTVSRKLPRLARQSGSVRKNKKTRNQIARRRGR